MRDVAIKARTALALGMPSLARALRYRLGIRTGLNPVRRLQALIPPGPFFAPHALRPTPDGVDSGIALSAFDSLPYFGWFHSGRGGIPDWHCNPFNGKNFAAPERPWWRLPDFDPELGDIKTIWEASRFDWVLALAQRAAGGRSSALEQLNAWLASWADSNPAYLGPNWKCGQEASIRVMHLAISALLLGQHRAPESALLELVRVHLLRIAPTLGYAIAQDNNHGTSEAAALYIGGSWLAARGHAEGRRWQEMGFHWLRNRALRLIALDGSFSQHSTVYHRVMLDTYAMVEVWRRQNGLPGFPQNVSTRLGAAANWLYQMTDPGSGDVPNLGANDGARLLPLTAADYRDFRPSVQLACALFLQSRAYAGNGSWEDGLRWLDVPVPSREMPARHSAFMPDGGYGLLHGHRSFALFRIPRYRFRPSQADALHVDFWVNGENVLRDGGSFSYSATPELLRYFGGTESHNTVQFDDHDQMPRLSRFLFGAWLKAKSVKPVRTDLHGASCAAGYRDWLGCSHHREVALSDGCLRVIDRVAGFREKATLRWRLQAGNWSLRDGILVNGRQGHYELRISADVPIKRIELVTGIESRYYMNTTQIPVLEIELDRPGTLTTELQFQV